MVTDMMPVELRIRHGGPGAHICDACQEMFATAYVDYKRAHNIQDHPGSVTISWSEPGTPISERILEMNIRILFP